jgi:hypothetical protein
VKLSSLIPPDLRQRRVKLTYGSDPPTVMTLLEFVKANEGMNPIDLGGLISGEPVKFKAMRTMNGKVTAVEAHVALV